MKFKRARLFVIAFSAVCAILSSSGIEAQTVKIRNLPTNPTPSLLDYLVTASVASTNTYKVTANDLFSLRTITCTPPLLCGGSASHTLGSDFTLSVTTFVASGGSRASGIVPDPGASAGTTKFLREDATWAIPPGSGGGSSTVTSVTGPSELSWATATTTPTATWASQTQGKVLASPATSTGTPAFRALVATDIPTLNQTTTGSAAKWTTPRNLAGNSVDGSASVAFANKFIVQGTSDGGLSAAQFLGALATGIVKNTTATGVLSIADAADLPAHAASHKNGGGDEVATATPTANAIPKAGAGGTLAAGWIPTLNQNTTGTAGGLSVTLDVAHGGTNLTTATDDAVLLGNGTSWQAKNFPACADTGGNHLNYDSSSNTISCGTSSSGGGASGDVTTYTTADQSVTSSTTLVTSMTVTLASSTAYQCTVLVHASASLSGGGIYTNLNGTLTATNFREEFSLREDSSFTYVDAETVNAMNVSTVGASNSGPLFAKYEGVIEVAAGGTLRLQWAQLTSSANVSKVLRGSSMVCRKM